LRLRLLAHVGQHVPKASADAGQPAEHFNHEISDYHFGGSPGCAVRATAQHRDLPSHLQLLACVGDVHISLRQLVNAVGRRERTGTASIVNRSGE